MRGKKRELWEMVIKLKIDREARFLFISYNKENMQFQSLFFFVKSFSSVLLPVSVKT